ncbi:MAG: serine/threonine-protein kinase [Paracoccus sp. (in: a-proteobacteria)]|uniref:serine/threonine protein kinase n=1 Tax=Paracoccus sp. TaxID=267 RepID=UPI0026DF90E6|nr:serine/threonine-protein kinase [Paracoccus sp. (in: a-proteobacteria)]MDO5622819.1 serine/threonine-protein kinase [Paracoccus sp. (in: a-proteobacteria)]
MSDQDSPDDRTRLVPSSRPPSDATVIAATQPAASGPVPRDTLINNNYRIIEQISAGGMGEVYRAENLFTGDPVAVKVILPGLASDEVVLDMFQREARVLVQLRDDAIVRYHNFVMDHGLGRYCLIMEFVEGPHLGSKVKSEGPLTDDAALALLRRLAAGLARAHARGVTHRDLSPDNVILRDDHISEAVLIDFGIARSTEFGDGLQGRFAGKFKYIAPEQLGHWDGEIGPWTDVYGLGLLIAMVVRGKPLNMGESVISASAARQAIPDLSGISHRIFPLLQYMLEPDPAHRVPDMPAVLRLLDDPMSMPAQYRLPLWPGDKGGEDDTTDHTGTGSLLTGKPITASLLPGDITASESPFAGITQLTVPQEIPARTQSKLPLLTAGAAVLSLLAGVGIWLMREVPEPAPEQPQTVVAEMVPRDLTTREGFLASQPLSSCTFARRAEQGPNAGMIEVLSSQPADTGALEAAYAQQFGAVPAFIAQQISPAQCAIADFLREISGRPAPAPALTAEITATGHGFQIAGQVQRQNQSLWLFIATPDGEVYDLTDQVQPQGRFAINIQAADNEAPYLLVALGTAAPLLTVTAAPAGIEATTLLPKVLDEMNRNAENPTADVIVFGSGEG